MSSDSSDEELIALLRQGDSRALGTLYQRYRRVVNAVILAQLKVEPSDVDDLCHDVFLTLQDTAHRFQPGRSLKGWLCGIALQKARRFRATRGLRRALLFQFSRREPATWNAPLGLDIKRDVMRALDRLPQSMREIMVLSFVEELSAEEIAELLGISVNAVWIRLSRARARIREILQEEP
jgi:RNA polymerase sigma-70 factor (ECF subfamily)